MTARTRYFVVCSLLVLGVGLGTGLVAYYVGFTTSAFGGRGGPEELRLIPSTAAVVAYADVAQVMSSDVRRKLREVTGDEHDQGRAQFEQATGINIETDIDHVVACTDPGLDSTQGAALVLARGRFDVVKIEALIREHGGHAEDYKGKRIVTASQVQQAAAPSFSAGFIQPGLIAFGTTNLVEHAIDLQTGGGQSAATNDELMAQVRALDSGNAWAVGRFDVLRANAKLPPGLTTQIPPITWFAVSGNVDGGVRGTVRVEARDDEAANNLREVVRGFIALGRMQAGARPELTGVFQALELGGAGKTVALSFDVPVQVFDQIGLALKARKPAASTR
jgi:hypothetical protein